MILGYETLFTPFNSVMDVMWYFVAEDKFQYTSIFNIRQAVLIIFNNLSGLFFIIIVSSHVHSDCI